MNGHRIKILANMVIVLSLMTIGLGVLPPVAHGQEPGVRYSPENNPLADLTLKEIEVETIPEVISEEVVTQATVRYVAVGGNCGGANPCYATIQAALDAAVNGDEIRIKTGTHFRPDLSYLQVGKAHNKQVTLVGGWCANWTHNPTQCPTAIDGDGSVRGLAFSGPSSNVTIRDLTFQNTYSPPLENDPNLFAVVGHGGGVVVYDGVFTIENCRFVNNFALGTGGGVMIYKAEGFISNNTFTGNVVRDYHGGGVYVAAQPEHVQITNNIFFANVASNGGAVAINQAPVHVSGNKLLLNQARGTIGGSGTFHGFGGGVMVVNGLSGSVDHNVIQRNRAIQKGGGIWARDSYVSLEVNAVTSNDSASGGSGIHVQGPSQFTPQLFQNTVAQNQDGEAGIYFQQYAGGDPFLARNNLVAFNEGPGIKVVGASPSQNVANIDHLLRWDDTIDTSQGSATLSNIIVNNPLLREDFVHLQSGSPARGTGASYTGTDIDGQSFGSPPDIGADQYNPGDPLLPQVRTFYLPIIFKQ